jgi:DNA-binding response OmpR family regulator
MSEKIMIVDDDSNTLRLLQHIIQSNGYQTIAVSSGTEALARIHAERPDLMILDVMMPDVSGLEVCQQIRADPKIGRLPIIMLSARTQVADKISGLQAGADEYVTKPITAPELLARIQALLQTSRRWAQTEPARKQRTIGVIGAKGGVGATTLTLNIAAALAQDKKDVIAVELSSRLGGFALQLKQQPSQNLAILLAQEARLMTPKAISDRLLSLPLQLRVLCGPQSPADFADISAGHAEAILNGLSNAGEYVIVDIADLPLAATQKAAQLCHYIVLVVETEPICVATARSLLDLFRSWGIASQIGAAAINRAPLASAMNLRAIHAQLDCDMLGVIPYAADAQIAAQAAGAPLVAFQPKSLAATSMIEIARRLGAETITGIRSE